MGLFSWNQKYEVGCAAIDDEHKLLFAMADKLHAAMSAGHGNTALKPLFQELVDYTQTHFRHEETLMHNAGYPAFRDHKAHHDALTSRVLELRAKSSTGKLTVTLDTMRFLSEWLNQHIAQEDRQAAQFLNAHAAR